MADLEFGLRKGLSVQVPYDAMVNDEYRHYQIQKQRSLEAENKAKLFADDFDYKNAVNPQDNPIIKEQARKQISAIGTFIRDNPGWEKDISKRIQYKAMVKDLKDNPDLNRGLLSDSNYAQLQKDLAEKSKKPELFDRDAYNDQLQQWQNYLTYGNQGGAEALKAEGKKAFVYSQPQDFVDLAASGLEKGNKFNQFKIEALKGGGRGSYQEKPDEKALESVAQDEYIRNKRQYDKEYTQKGFDSPFEYAKANIRAGIKTKFDYGDIDSPLEWTKLDAKNHKVQPDGVWSKDIVNVDKSTVNGAVLKDALGATPPLKIKNRNGTGFVDLTGSEVNYTGRNTYMGDSKKSGVKYFEVTTKIPLEKAKQLGIYGGLIDEDITHDWKGKAYVKNVTRQIGNEEKTESYIELNDFIPFDVNNATFQGIYDQKSTTSKFQQAPSADYQEQPSTVIQGGVTYILNPQTGKYE